MSIYTTIKDIAAELEIKQWSLVTAESCTAGLVAKHFTDLPISSTWFERGFVTYSNLAKQELLNVPAEIIERYDAVSEQTVRAMAEGALQNSHAQVSLAVTGFAGPDGGTPESPVGTVWFAWASQKFPTKTKVNFFTGDRISICDQASHFALKELLNYLCVK